MLTPRDYSVPSGLRQIRPETWETLPEDLAYNFRTLAAQSGGAGGALATWFFGSGRQVGANWQAGQITPPPTPANAFIVPNATYWIAGRLVVVDEPNGGLVVGDLPDAPGTYHVYLDADADTGEVFVDPDTGFLGTRADDRARAYLGTVTTNGVAVSAVDGAASDYLQPFQLLAARFVPTGGGGGGNTVDLSGILARLEDLEKRVAAIENNEGGDLVAVQNDSEALHVEVLAMAGYLVEQFPGMARVLKAAWNIPGATGNAEPLPDGPARTTWAGGNAQRSARDHAIK